MLVAAADSLAASVEAKRVMSDIEENTNKRVSRLTKGLCHAEKNNLENVPRTETEDW